MDFQEWLLTEEGRLVSFYPAHEMCRRSYEAGQRNAPSAIPLDVARRVVSCLKYTEALGDCPLCEYYDHRHNDRCAIGNLSPESLDALVAMQAVKA